MRNVWRCSFWKARRRLVPNLTDSRACGAQTISCRAAFGAQTERCIDQNFKDRWRTLLSVDDMISEVFALTESVGVHDDTYYIYSSDHGYSLGELNLNWDKRNVCEQTTSLLSRPFCAFYMRGNPLLVIESAVRTFAQTISTPASTFSSGTKITRALVSALPC